MKQSNTILIDAENENKIGATEIKLQMKKHQTSPQNKMDINSNQHPNLLISWNRLEYHV